MRTLPIAPIVPIALAAMLALVPALAAAQTVYTPIEQRLTADQLHATGLDQLGTEQLALLNQLLSQKQSEVRAELARERERAHIEKPSPIASTLRAEFRGWKTGKVFELANGQRWRVIEGEFYAARPLQNPAATVEPGAFGSWYLRIAGVGVRAKVKRVD